MEDITTKYRPRGVRVTDLTAQLWCEKQLEFSLKKGKTETEEMREGKKRHTKLHEEIFASVKVVPKTLADSIALQLHNMQVKLRRLLEEKMTREVFIYGKVNSLSVVGMIDEINIQDGRLYLLDTKTRKLSTMPSDAQKRTARFQLMIYHKLLKDLTTGKFSEESLTEIFDFNCNDRISEEFEQQICDIGKTIEPNMWKLMAETFGLFRQLPELNESLLLQYEFQNTGRVIGTDQFSFDAQTFQKNCDFVEQFWLGQRPAMPVGMKNAWKCGFCEFNEICEVKPKGKILTRKLDKRSP